MANPTHANPSATAAEPHASRTVLLRMDSENAMGAPLIDHRIYYSTLGHLVFTAGRWTVGQRMFIRGSSFSRSIPQIRQHKSPAAPPAKSQWFAFLAHRHCCEESSRP